MNDRPTRSDERALTTSTARVPAAPGDDVFDDDVFDDGVFDDRPADHSHPGGDGAGRRWWLQHAIAAVVAPIVLFLVLRPEAYGLTPNALDPLFYTGYAINFDDIMRELGTGRYFVSRWTGYYPSYIAASVFGPVLGRLLVRLALAAAMLLAAWHLGRRWAWTVRHEVLVAVVVLTMPMFARAFLTDYVEFTVVSIGFVLVCQCLELRATLARSATIGLCAGVLVVANPLTIPMLGPALLGYTVLNRDEDPHEEQGVNGVWVARAITTAVIALGIAAVIGIGYVLFHQYGIQNVYQPSIDFMKESAGYHDPLKSPRLTWLLYFVWIYGPIILLAAGAALPHVRAMIRSDRVVAFAAVLLVVQFTWQGLDQFVRDGDGLEIAYYWSYICPTFLAATAIFIGVHAVRSWWTVIGFSTAWTAGLAWRIWAPFDLPPGVWFVIIAVVAIAGAVRLASWRPDLPWIPVLGLVLLTQVAAPDWVPFAFHPYDMSPDYDQIAFHSRSDSARVLDEIVWFEQRLDELPTDVDLSFITADAASSGPALYGAQLTGAAINLDPITGLPAPQQDAEFRSGARPRVAIYGPPGFVQGIVDSLSDIPSVTRLDAIDRRGFGYRLVVLDDLGIGDGTTRSYAASTLPGSTGILDGTDRVAIAGRDLTGFLTFGPFDTLRPGRYLLHLNYSSPADTPLGLGVFEATTDEGRRVAATTGINGTAGDPGTVELEFVVRPGDVGVPWEFRTQWPGYTDIRIMSIDWTLVGDT
ncbi:MAG: hypothetical protein ABIO83_03160 [Ilumatobacteraceae bacterium]